MNRYTVAGVVADVTLGRRVLVVTANQRASRNALESITAGLVAGPEPRPEVRVFRANGMERIDRPAAGGGVTFRSVRQGGHGLSADVLVLEGPVEDLGPWLPCLAASSVGEVIR